MKRKDFVLKLRQRLLQRRDALRQSLVGEVTALRADRASGVGDQADEAVQNEHEELSTRLAQAESRELAQIERALRRMRAGGFGKCVKCGGAIATPRLQALPYVSDCITCARKDERARSWAEERSRFGGGSSGGGADASLSDADYSF